jgi:hypothetical protein
MLQSIPPDHLDIYCRTHVAGTAHKGIFGHTALAIYQIVRTIYEGEASVTCRRHSAQDTQGLRFGGAVVWSVFEDMSGVDRWLSSRIISQRYSAPLRTL